MFFIRIEGQITNRSNQTVDAERNHREEEIRQTTGSESLRLQIRVIDDHAADPTEEKCKQETNQIVVIHIQITSLK